MMGADDDTPFENSPGPNNKLIRTKEQWARDGRGLTGETSSPQQSRLPPGQHIVADWPVLDLGTVPNITRADWKLTVAGACRNRITWTFDDLMAAPQTESVSDIHCVTTWSRYAPGPECRPRISWR